MPQTTKGRLDALPKRLFNIQSQRGAVVKPPQTEEQPHHAKEYLLTVEELAISLRVSSSTIRRYMEEGLPSVSFSRKTRRFNREEVLAWFKERGK